MLYVFSINLVKLRLLFKDGGVCMSSQHTHESNVCESDEIKENFYLTHYQINLWPWLLLTVPRLCRNSKWILGRGDERRIVANDSSVSEVQYGGNDCAIVLISPFFSCYTKVCLVSYFTKKMSFGPSFCRMELNIMQNFW
jgi:hypothetical protein